MFHTGNQNAVSFPSESAVVALWTYASPVVGSFQGGDGKANLRLGAGPGCARAPQKRPQREGVSLRKALWIECRMLGSKPSCII